MKVNKNAKTSPPEGDLWTGKINQYTDPIAENPNSQQAANLIVVEYSSWVACQTGNNPVPVASNTILANVAICHADSV